MLKNRSVSILCNHTIIWISGLKPSLSRRGRMQRFVWLLYLQGTNTRHRPLNPINPRQAWFFYVGYLVYFGPCDTWRWSGLLEPVRPGHWPDWPLAEGPRPGEDRQLGLGRLSSCIFILFYIYYTNLAWRSSTSFTIKHFTLGYDICTTGINVSTASN